MKKENEKIFIDGLDKVILKALMTDARKSINEIAKNAGISGAAVHQRLKKLENAKLISGSQIIINPKISFIIPTPILKIPLIFLLQVYHLLL